MNTIAAQRCAPEHKPEESRLSLPVHRGFMTWGVNASCRTIKLFHLVPFSKIHSFRLRSCAFKSLHVLLQELPPAAIVHHRGRMPPLQERSISSLAGMDLVRLMQQQLLNKSRSRLLRRSGFHSRHPGAKAVGIGIPTYLLR